MGYGVTLTLGQEAPQRHIKLLKQLILERGASVFRARHKATLECINVHFSKADQSHHFLRPSLRCILLFATWFMLPESSFKSMSCYEISRMEVRPKISSIY